MKGLDQELINPITELSLEGSDLYKSFKYFMLDMKMQVDRWDFVVSHYAFHSSLKPLVLEFLKADAYLEGDDWTIWGAILVFTPDIAEDEVFAIDKKSNHDDIPDNRYISKGVLPSKDMQKYLNLKAFW